MTTEPKRKLKTPPKRRGRVHAICSDCYHRSPLQREPFPVSLPLCYWLERCCFCNGWTSDAIYVRTARVPRRGCCKPGKYPKKPVRQPGPVYGVIRRTRDGRDIRELEPEPTQ